jgi:hypothetical protein
VVKVFTGSRSSSSLLSFRSSSSILKRNQSVLFTLKSIFINHPQIHLARSIKYWNYNLTAAILSKVQREPRFFQLIRYLSSYIYVILCTHLLSLPSPKSRWGGDYFSISRDDWSLYILDIKNAINVLINQCVNGLWHWISTERDTLSLPGMNWDIKTAPISRSCWCSLLWLSG